MSRLSASLPSRLASLVKLEHTVFALPFAYVGAFLAVDDFPGWPDLAWITVAMAGARTLAMGLNRLVDAELDARNPRTAARELPTGALSRSTVIGLCLLSLGSSWSPSGSSTVVRWLWPIPVALFVVYPYLKRWTWLCTHFWLGAPRARSRRSLGRNDEPALGRPGRSELPWRCGSPASISSTPSSISTTTDARAALVGGAVRRARVFTGARLMHVGAVVLLAAAGLGLSVGIAYWLGVLVVAALLVYEHSLVRPGTSGGSMLPSSPSTA